MANKISKLIGEMYGKSAEEIEKAVKAADKPISIKTSTPSIFKAKSSIFYKIRQKITEFYHSNKIDIRYLLLIIPIIATYVLILEVQKYQSYLSIATEHQALIFIQPSTVNLPPQGTFDVWVNSDSGVGFAKIEMSFNPQLVNLTSEITTYQSLTRIIKVSTKAEANSTGKISLIIALDPAQRQTPPTGTFRVATFSLNPVTNNPLKTNLSFDETAMQLVAIDQSVFSLTTTGSTLTLNPATPTPTPSIPPSSSPTPTPTPTRTPIVTYVPTPTPAGKYELSGTVIDSFTSFYVAGATVKITRASGGRTVAQMKTDSIGHYGFLLKPDTYKISISKRGYNTIKNQIVVLDGPTIRNFQFVHK